MTSTLSSARASHRVLPVLLLLFVGSGAAALIYEIAWFQLLQLYVGSSAVSLGVLLGTFMGGMCLGSLLLPRVVSARHHPLRVYGLIELGIGIIGLMVLSLVPLVGGLYTAWGGEGLAGFLLRGVVAGICLLPPTLLMGATLPAIARWIETTPAGVSWLGFFYGGNIAGAVFGCLLAGFYLLRAFDAATATYVAVAINVAVAAVAIGLATRTPYHVAVEPDTSLVEPDTTPADAGRLGPGAAVIYVAIALSGFSALAAEVIWTRVLGLLFGASTYSFSLILAVFLVGLGIGSSVGSVMARSITSPRVALGTCQLLAASAIAWTGYMLAESLPYWPVSPSLSSNIWLNFQLDIVRAFWAVLPATLFWGASFPLALGALAVRGQDAGRLVGGVYAANTVGAIAGALGASLLLIAWLGSQIAQQALVVASAVAGLLVLAPAFRVPRWAAIRVSAADATALVSVAGVAAVLAGTVPPPSSLLVAYGRNAATHAPSWVDPIDVIYTGEGLNSSVAVSRLSNGVLNYHNAGKVQASSEPQDMRLQRMLGHLTTLVPKAPRSVLVIGCGAGVTAGAVAIDPAVEQVTIAEIEPLVPRVVSRYFAAHNFDVLASPKVRVHYDDARHYLLTSQGKFDAITSDPLDPWVKGAATLYTKEFFEVVKNRLNPGGVVTVFVQLYESNTEAVKSEVATFFEVFPDGIVWGNTYQGAGYDMVLLGQVDPAPIDLDELDRRLTEPASAAVAQSLREIGIYSAVDLLSTYAGRGPDLTAWRRDAAINRDENLRLQYLAGMALNLYQAGAIYADLLTYRRFPEDLFVGSESLVQRLRAALEMRPSE